LSTVVTKFDGSRGPAVATDAVDTDARSERVTVEADEPFPLEHEMRDPATANAPTTRNAVEALLTMRYLRAISYRACAGTH
jgi:hypothetical protein